MARIDGLGDLGAVVDLLQESDRSRLQRMTSLKRRRELLAGRWLLRALSAHLGLPRLLFDGAGEGAGVLVRTPRQIDPGCTASVTHAGQWVACAFGHADGVGVDLEVLVERDFLALTKAAFADAADDFQALAPEERKVAFYRRWTRHEAATKRNGTVGREASWLLPGQWVLSLNWTTPAEFPAAPLIWNESTCEFLPLRVETLPGLD